MTWMLQDEAANPYLDVCQYAANSDEFFKRFKTNINQSKKNKFLDFLTIETNQMIDNNYEMKIVFAGDSIIKIIAEVIEVTLDDQGEAWDTKNTPKHKLI